MGAFPALLCLISILGYAPLPCAKRIHKFERIVSDADSHRKTNTTLTTERAKDPIYENLVHRCVEVRAKDYLELLTRLKISIPQGVPERSTVQLVQDIVAIKDMLSHRQSSRSGYEKLLHWDVFSSSVEEWNNQVTYFEDELRKWGFDYEAAANRCDKGANDEAYECMLKRAGPSTSDLWVQVKQRIDVKDVLVHSVAAKGTKPYDILWRWVEHLDAKLKYADYDWSTIKAECRKVMEDEAKVIQNHIVTDLSQGATAQDGSQVMCTETPGGMCPEGTYVTTKRHKSLVKTVTATAVTLAVALVNPVGAVLAFAVTYWATLDPDECACFIRDCAYVHSEGGCRLLTTQDESPTRNEYGLALPMTGMKCELQYKSVDTCVMVSCGSADYEGHIEDAGFAESAISLYGKLGRQGTGIFNCLSKNGMPTGAVHLDTHLPTGNRVPTGSIHSDNGTVTPYTDNIGKTRAKLYSLLQSHDERFGKLPTPTPAPPTICADRTAIAGSGNWMSCDYDNMEKATSSTAYCQCSSGWQYSISIRRCQWCGLGECNNNVDIPKSNSWNFCNSGHMHSSHHGFCRCDTGYQPDASGHCIACELPVQLSPNSHSLAYGKVFSAPARVVAVAMLATTVFA